MLRARFAWLVIVPKAALVGVVLGGLKDGRLRELKKLYAAGTEG